MIETFGNYIDDLPGGEYLVIGFSPSSMSLKQRWKTNGLSADFIADYLQAFFTGASSNAPIPVQSKNAVKYIANELLENAMKFNDDTSPYQTKINFNLHADKLVFQVTNSITAPQVEKFKKFINKVLTEDPYELYVAQMEANANEETQGHSGLGFLSMVCDYSASLAWKFETVGGEPTRILVTTMVALDV